MIDLRDRLLAEIDRREQIARAASQPAWEVYDTNEGTPEYGHLWSVCNDPFVNPTEDLTGVNIVVDWGGREDAEQIAANDPVTVLRGLAEDRDILDRHTAGRWPSVEDGYDAPTCIGCGRDDQGDPRYLVPCPEVLSLARRHGIEVAS